jgi:uncharacterized protein (DUF169 family)
VVKIEICMVNWLYSAKSIHYSRRNMEESDMTTLNELNEYGVVLENSLLLRTSPLAIKILETENDIPAEALRPKRDRGYHLAQCQAFSLSRRQGNTVAMLKEDNWCWGSLFAYGLIERGVADNYVELHNDIRVIPMLEYGKYIGILSAPLRTANFIPDLVMIYSNTSQLRQMLHVLSFINEGIVDSPIYPVASCAFSVVPSFQGRNCITLPDPGEVGRALAGEDEIIFSLPTRNISKLVSQIKAFDEMRMGHRYHSFLEMRPDFPRPEFYKRLYRECGLDGDDKPTWPER